MDDVWMFSLSVTIINFIAFAFVAVAYVAVMLKVAKRMSQTSQGKDKENGTFCVILKIRYRNICRVLINKFAFYQLKHFIFLQKQTNRLGQCE